jgi:hypothetical protein
MLFNDGAKTPIYVEEHTKAKKEHKHIYLKNPGCYVMLGW